MCAESKKSIEELEDDLFSEDNSTEQPPSDIVAYNELRSCADLYRMYKSGILDINPDFQRDSVWASASQTRFIDSLVKQLPIPSMCFSLDHKTQKWQVIDGMQRMSTIIKFLSDDEWKLSKLDDIDPKLSGKFTSKMKDEESSDHILYQRLQNLTIPVTVLRCDHSKSTHSEYLFTIFHRLNTGGVKLNNQEIRNCIFSGSLNSALKDINATNSDWDKINKGKDSRFKRVEMMLRFFAFREELGNYKGSLSKFLNEYMRKNRNISQMELEGKRLIFEETVSIVRKKILNTSPKVSLSLLEALLVGVSHNYSKLSELTAGELKSKYAALKSHDKLSSEYLSEGIASKEKVKARLQAAIEIFS